VSEREELQAALRARRELGAEYEPQIVDSFLERIEKRLDERVKARPVRRDEPEHRMVTPMVLGSLGLAIPLIGIAGATAGAAGVALVCVAIVLVNLLAMRR
jgi:anti-sigma factor RsiW